MISETDQPVQEEDAIEMIHCRVYFNVISSFWKCMSVIMSRLKSLSHAKLRKTYRPPERAVKPISIRLLRKELRKVLGNRAMYFLLIYLSL